MSDVSIAGIQQALSQNSRKTSIGDWVVGTGSTPTTINAVKADGSIINLSANVQTNLTNAVVSFEAPGNNDGQYRFITAITSAGVITLDEALSATPDVGNPFTILAQTRVDVTAAENVAQWGGANVQAADANGIPNEQQAYTEAATGSAVPTHTLQVGGSDGTDLRTLLTDTSGRVILGPSTQGIGAVTEASIDDATSATGSAVPAKTIQVGGSDGTDLQTLLTDTDGTTHINPAKLGAWTPANLLTINNVAEAATTAFGSFTPTTTGIAAILVSASATTVLSLTTLGQTSALNGGTGLTAAEWYTFQMPVVSGQSYSFQISAAASISMNVIANTTA